MTSRVVAFPASARPARRFPLRVPLAGLLGRILERMKQADRLYRERLYLEEMDDRMLRDIGVTRAEIEAELRGPASWSALLFRG